MEFELNVAVRTAYGQSLLKKLHRQEPSLLFDHAFFDLRDCKVHAVTELIQECHDL